MSSVDPPDGAGGLAGGAGLGGVPALGGVDALGGDVTAVTTEDKTELTALTTMLISFPVEGDFLPVGMQVIVGTCRSRQ